MISGQLLVRPLAVEHDLETGAASLGEDAPLRENASAAVGFVLMPGYLFGQRERVLDPRIAPMRRAAGMVDHRLHERPLVNALLRVTGADIVYPRTLAQPVE